MSEIRFPSLIDSHIHINKVSEIANFIEVLDAVHAGLTGLACQTELNPLNTNPAGFVLKLRFPDRFFLMAGLDHSGLLFNPNKKLSLADQVRVLDKIGIDGIKILATKPSVRKWLGEPAHGPYFMDFFKVCEELDLPLLWHVADPEEFWDHDKLPSWARKQDWGYDKTYLSKEELYTETENVLRRFPSLRVIFPHFYFLSADLDSADKLLEDFPNISFDLAPGIELYYNLSRQFKRARDFFIRYADRILFGTDVLSSHSPVEAQARAGIVYRFLTGKEEFRVPDNADFLLGPPEDGIIRGLDLPQDAVEKILKDNFVKIFGNYPKKQNIDSAVEECKRLAEIEAEIKSILLKETEGAQAEILLTAQK